MERLTTKFHNGYLFNLPGVNDEKAQEEYVEKLSMKLGEYEDAEEQGLLLRLPCKVGTPVYMVEQDCGGDTLDCRSGGCEGCEYLYRYIEENEFQLYMCEQIGKNVFFTREAAEAALAEKGE